GTILTEIDPSFPRGPWRAERLQPETIDRRAAIRLRPGIDTRGPRSLQADLMLQSAVIAVGVSRSARDVRRQQGKLGGNAEESDIARTARELAMRVRMAEHEVLHDELDVDHSARIVLDVQGYTRVRVSRVHPAPHLDDLVLQSFCVSRQPQDRLALGLECSAE